MGTITSFIKSHIQADERKSRKRLITLSVSLLLLTALIVAVVGVRTLLHRPGSGDAPATPTTPAEAVRSICSLTRYPKSCFSSLISANSIDPEIIFQFSLTVAIKALEAISNFPEDYAKRLTGADGQLVKEALGLCGAALNDAVESLNDAVSATGLRDADDLKTWLSAALTNQDTCLDALGEAEAAFSGEVERLMGNATEFASNSLAIVARLLAVEPGDFPAWITAADRRLLQDVAAVSNKVNVVVAKDGSGHVKTIKGALALVEKKSKKRFVIHVKAGVYEENLMLNKSFWNVMIIGEGKNNTIITGNKNFVDGTLTFVTATLAVSGKGFIARDLTIRNTAGPEKHQAVAFRSGSDLSVFYRCSFDGFQDTLYAHSNRQFYRECDITGTVDFIFGNAAVVFQNCNINPRQPLLNQFNTITAQGKKDPNQNTGICIQRCVISPLGNVTAVTYFGRPWKDYSTTIIMQSNIDVIVNPLGWTPWLNVPPASIFYAEYLNIGPGANTSNRVKWRGYKSNLTAAQASKYDVQSFINGRSWLPVTGVTYEATL
ncbi:pectinesterase 3 [Phtheirospermum japonicum]|uniref:Pectinesterase n=1 Tax=Phtheirospermum japonicum TaxID=374723 RepID=A0A830CDY8_9LAMI|nr:pectinesterase 3 [Phtheirospermum japonicum]